jgi:hypothetical protein
VWTAISKLSTAAVQAIEKITGFLQQKTTADGCGARCALAAHDLPANTTLALAHDAGTCMPLCFPSLPSPLPGNLNDAVLEDFLQIGHRANDQ